MTDEEKNTADNLDTIRSHTEELIRGACLLLKACHASPNADIATAWGTVASAKATLYLAEVIRAQAPRKRATEGATAVGCGFPKGQVCVLRGRVPRQCVELLLGGPGLRCLPEDVQPEAPR